MLNFRTLLMAAGLSVGVAFAMPATSQAMPQIAPIKVDAAKDSNIVDVRHKKRWKRWARYCRHNWDDWRCHRRHRSARFYRHRYYNPYYEPYYGYYEPYPYYYGRRFYGPGIGFSFRF
jgi:hypothetical protein